MTIEQIKNEIERLTVFLLTNGLVLGTNSPIIRENRNQRILTWSGAPKTGLINKNFATIPEYLRVTLEGQYNFVLQDGGVVQFGYIFNNNLITKQRICFFPCPIDITPDDLDMIQPGDDFVSLFLLLLEGELSDIGVQIEDGRLSEMKGRLFTRTPFYFEFDPSSQSSTHSASHLHINKRSCRLPVFGPISVGHFIRFIFRSFYPDIWGLHSELREWPLNYFDRTVVDEQTLELYLNSSN